MIEKQEWRLPGAAAHVVRWKEVTLVEVRGVVMPTTYEAVHMHLAREPAHAEVWLVLDWPALLACTNRSAVEAAARGTPAKPMHRRRLRVLVPRARMQWARRHCELMNQHGIACEPGTVRLSAWLLAEAGG